MTTREARQRANPAGNERLTAMTGAVLLVLFAAECLTLLNMGKLLTLHFFLGMLLLGPAGRAGPDGAGGPAYPLAAAMRVPGARPGAGVRHLPSVGQLGRLGQPHPVNARAAGSRGSSGPRRAAARSGAGRDDVVGCVIVGHLIIGGGVLR